MAIAFEKQVVVITGAGGGLGRAYAEFFGSRGAYVVVNDFSKQAADATVAQINNGGKGQAIANYDSVLEGGKIIAQAVDKWGRIDILINNAGFLRDKSFKAMTDKEWDDIQGVHVKAAFLCSHAAWPIMRKQKFGRIINTSSAAGIYGNFGQANYSAAKFALVGFSKTLAREGAKYNITCNAIAPIAASAMTKTVMPPEMLENLKPEAIVPLVAYLVSSSSKVSGKVFEAGAGWYGAVRWQRSNGVVFKTDDSFTPAAVQARWGEVLDWSKDPQYPENITDAKHLDYLEEAKKMSTNKSGAPISYKGQTVLITGAGAGLGRAYAHVFAKGGANVVVNDMNAESANKVVEEIKQLGAKAIAVVASAEEGEKLISETVKAFGTIHIAVCNAGILRDKSFLPMTEKEWDQVYAVHLRGTYKVAHAAWPIFLKQKYGRIITTSSSVGLYGNFGQANYSCAKSGIIAFTKTLAIEGKKYGILANCLAPNAGTAMTRTIWPEEMVRAFLPDFVAPIVGFLGSKENQTTGGMFEVSGGWVAADRINRSAGYGFPVNKDISPEDIADKIDAIMKFDDGMTFPSSTAESIQDIVANFSNKSEGQSWADSEDPAIVVEAKKLVSEGSYGYTDRDVMLYNLGIGAKANQLKYIFEGADDFQALPTFGVIPQFQISSGLDMSWLPNFSPMMLLHGEQYLAIKAPIPSAGTLNSKSVISEVLDKGKAAAVTTFTTTEDSDGKVIFENQSTVFIRGAGGFGGKKVGIDRGAATALNKPPSRSPDCVVEEKTTNEQAAVYRLSGDYNPLHVDPSFASVGGFKQPILHGLCFFGIAGKAVYEKYGPYKDIKVRFSGFLFPGETVVTEMWKEGNKVIFSAKCKERGTVILSSAAATLA